MVENSLSSFSEVLSVELEALQRLALEPPLDFSDLVESVLRIKGRVIVSGVGKSGHIGRKIAATLASTGTPSFFVHANEASHGDLGMLSRDDFCLVLSNSGETGELRDIVLHSKRIGVPVAVITSNAESFLAKEANFKLILPSFKEACAVGMAPTTSTTLMLVLGDPIAVSLMKQRAFEIKDFKFFHPGGRLGFQLSLVSEMMRSVEETPIFHKSTSMSEVVLGMTKAGFGLAGIVDDSGALVGVITDGDLRRNLDDLFSKAPVSVMSTNPRFILPYEFALDAALKMRDNKIYSLLVCDENNKPVGMLRMHDLLSAGLI